MPFKLFRSDPTTGEVYETKDVETIAEKKHAMTPEGGMWFETPRWHTDPKPHGFDPSNPYEKPVATAYAEYPRTLHKKIGMDPTTKQPIWQTLVVKDPAGKTVALKGKYLLTPNEAQHAEMAITDPEAQEIERSLVSKS